MHYSRVQRKMQSQGFIGPPSKRTKFKFLEGIPFIRVRFFVAVNFNYQSKKWMQENLNGTKVEVSATGKEYVKASLQKWTVQTLDLNGCNCASFKQLGYQALV